MALSIYAGLYKGYYATLAAHGPLTAAELAARLASADSSTTAAASTSGAEARTREVRQWLGQQVALGLVGIVTEERASHPPCYVLRAGSTAAMLLRELRWRLLG